jgi:hypothetical protein
MYARGIQYYFDTWFADANCSLAAGERALTISRTPSSPTAFAPASRRCN